MGRYVSSSDKVHVVFVTYLDPANHKSFLQNESGKNKISGTVLRPVCLIQSIIIVV